MPQQTAMLAERQGGQATAEEEKTHGDMKVLICVSQ